MKAVVLSRKNQRLVRNESGFLREAYDEKDIHHSLAELCDVVMNIAHRVVSGLLGLL